VDKSDKKDKIIINLDDLQDENGKDRIIINNDDLLPDEREVAKMKNIYRKSGRLVMFNWKVFRNAFAVFILFFLLIFAGYTAIQYFAGLDRQAQINEEVITDPVFSPTDSNKIIEDPQTGMLIEGGTVMVVIHEEITMAEVSDAAVSVNGEVVGGREDIRVFEIAISQDDPASTHDAIARLEGNPIFKAVLPNYVPAGDSLSKIPDVPQWQGKGATSQNRRWGQEKIHMPSAWAFNTGIVDQRIAVIDSGFDLSHPDLHNAVLFRVDQKNHNKLDHGTSVASVIGACAYNNTGKAGILWQPKLYCYQVSSFKDIKTALEHAYRNGTRVVNISMSIDFESMKKSSEEEVEARVKAIRLMLEPLIEIIGQDNGLYNAGMVVISSAGNNPDISADINYPQGFATDYDHVISVGSVSKNDERSSFSSYGQSVSVAAPGSRIWVARGVRTIGSNYRYASGTSFSSPMVAGVAGLLLAVNPELSPGEVKNIIMETASPRNFDRPLGAGILDAAGALLAAGAAGLVDLTELDADYYIDYTGGTIPIGDLPIGARVVDPGWEWEFRTGHRYTSVEGDETKFVTWIVVAKDHYSGLDPHVTLLSEGLIGRFAFDNSTNRGSQYGSYHWGDSGTGNASHGLRPWLNSTGIHSGEGLYQSFSENFRSAILTTTVPNKERKNDRAYSTSDKVFTPSNTELGDTSHTHTHQIGTVYPYFHASDNAKRVARFSGEAVEYWSRTPGPNFDHVVRVVGSKGGAFDKRAYSNNSGVRPALNLKSEILVSEIKN